jgi:hypothetical protein
MAYLTGRAPFGPFEFNIDNRALIPRSFIAELLLDQLYDTKEQQRQQREGIPKSGEPDPIVGPFDWLLGALDKPLLESARLSI